MECKDASNWVKFNGFNMKFIRNLSLTSQILIDKKCILPKTKISLNFLTNKGKTDTLNRFLIKPYTQQDHAPIESLF